MNEYTNTSAEMICK